MGTFDDYLAYKMQTAANNEERKQEQSEADMQQQQELPLSLISRSSASGFPNIIGNVEDNPIIDPN